MNKNIIFLGGVHGVGKSVFSQKLKEIFPELLQESCSRVLKWKDSTEKKVKHISKNQDKLVDNLEKLIDINKVYLLDGHFSLLNRDNKAEKIPLKTFKGIDPAFIILLVEEPSIICQRLKKRDGKVWELSVIEDLCLKELEHARFVAKALEIPLIKITSDEIDSVKGQISSLLNLL